MQVSEAHTLLLLVPRRRETRSMSGALQGSREIPLRCKRAKLQVPDSLSSSVLRYGVVSAPPRTISPSALIADCLYLVRKETPMRVIITA